MRKNVTVRMICLIVAAVVLSGAVALAAVIGSPYDTLKKSLLETATASNVTIETNMTYSVDGIVQQSYKSHTVVGENAQLDYHFDNDGRRTGFNFVTDGLRVNGMPIFVDDNGLTWHSAYISPQDSNYYSNYGYAILSPEDRDSPQMRFAELFVDALVGDLKNNLTMTSADGSRIVRGTFTGGQLPEIIRAGIDVLIDQDNRWRGNDFTREDYIDSSPLEIPMRSLSVDYLRGEAEIDADGIIQNLEMTGSATIVNIFGDVHIFEYNLTISISDIGSSNPFLPLPDGIELLSADIMEERFGSPYMYVFFTLDENGRVNNDSVTTTHPGEQMSRDIFVAELLPEDYNHLRLDQHDDMQSIEFAVAVE